MSGAWHMCGSGNYNNAMQWSWGVVWVVSDPVSMWSIGQHLICVSPCQHINSSVNILSRVSHFIHIPGLMKDYQLWKWDWMLYLMLTRIWTGYSEGTQWRHHGDTRESSGARYLVNMMWPHWKLNPLPLSLLELILKCGKCFRSVANTSGAERSNPAVTLPTLVTRLWQLCCNRCFLINHSCQSWTENISECCGCQKYLGSVWLSAGVCSVWGNYCYYTMIDAMIYKLG